MVAPGARALDNLSQHCVPDAGGPHAGSGLGKRVGPPLDASGLGWTSYGLFCRPAAVSRTQATCSKCSFRPSALATFTIVAKLGLPSAESAL